MSLATGLKVITPQLLGNAVASYFALRARHETYPPQVVAELQQMPLALGYLRAAPNASKWWWRIDTRFTPFYSSETVKFLECELSQPCSLGIHSHVFDELSAALTVSSKDLTASARGIYSKVVTEAILEDLQLLQQQAQTRETSESLRYGTLLTAIGYINNPAHDFLQDMRAAAKAREDIRCHGMYSGYAAHVKADREQNGQFSIHRIFETLLFRIPRMREIDDIFQESMRYGPAALRL